MWWRSYRVRSAVRRTARTTAVFCSRTSCLSVNTGVRWASSSGTVSARPVWHLYLCVFIYLCEFPFLGELPFNIFPEVLVLNSETDKLILELKLYRRSSLSHLSIIHTFCFVNHVNHLSCCRFVCCAGLLDLYCGLFNKGSKSINRVQVSRIIYTVVWGCCVQTEGLSHSLFKFFLKALSNTRYRLMLITCFFSN